jgi:hypothetical protein
VLNGDHSRGHGKGQGGRALLAWRPQHELRRLLRSHGTPEQSVHRAHQAQGPVAMVRRARRPLCSKRSAARLPSSWPRPTRPASSGTSTARKRSKSWALPHAKPAPLSSIRTLMSASTTSVTGPSRRRAEDSPSIAPVASPWCPEGCRRDSSGLAIVEVQHSAKARIP